MLPDKQQRLAHTHFAVPSSAHFFPIHPFTTSSSVRKMFWLLAGKLWNIILFPGQAGAVAFFKSAQTGSATHRANCPMGTGVFIRRRKRPCG
jgi:hypothetical protein